VVVGIGRAAVVNGILNGPITGVKEGEKMRPSKGGGNEGLDRLGPLHGVRWGRRGGLGAASCEVEVVLGRRRQRKKREAGRAKWAKRPSGPVGCVKKAFWNKKWIWEFTKALEICTRRFRRNFDTRIFPKFFYDPQGF
jgi:hypothetical protein